LRSVGNLILVWEMVYRQGEQISTRQVKIYLLWRIVWLIWSWSTLEWIRASFNSRTINTKQWKSKKVMINNSQTINFTHKKNTKSNLGCSYATPIIILNIRSNTKTSKRIINHFHLWKHVKLCNNRPSQWHNQRNIKQYVG